MSNLFIPQLTPDERLWRIDWFGECQYSQQRRGQPSIRVAISPLLCDPNDSKAVLAATATSLNNQRQAWLPIGMLDMVRIGGIWKNGQCLLTPTYQTEKFEELDIRKTTTDFIKSGLALNGNFYLPLDEHPWHRLQTMSYCLKVEIADGKQIIIPCVELIRFYFGSSSKLLNLLFTRQISGEDFWRSKLFDDATGNLHLKLAPGLSGMSAADIGRIALNGDAWNAARLIFDRCMIANLCKEPIFPFTGFPFVGMTNLIAAGKWLSNGGKPDQVFVVYSIRSCSHPFPFKSLSYEASDNKKVGVKKNGAGSSAEKNLEKSIGNSVRSRSQTLPEMDPGKSKASKILWQNGVPRFTDLAKKQIWRERYDTIDPPAVILQSAAQDEEVSLGQGSNQNKNIRDIDIAQGHNKQIQDIDLKEHKFVFDGIKLAISQANLQSKITTDLITLPGYSHPVISLPHLVDEHGEIHHISFCSDDHGGMRCRRGCFIELLTNGTSAGRLFIVERENILNMVRIINVSNFNLAVAMRELVDELPPIFRLPRVGVHATSFSFC